MNHKVSINTKKLLSLKPAEKTAVLDFVRKLREKYDPFIKEIILFGSKVRGDSGIGSDIDILITLSKLSWEIKKTISELAAQENLKHDVLISTIRYDVKIWENPAVKASPFSQFVRKEGIWL